MNALQARLAKFRAGAAGYYGGDWRKARGTWSNPLTKSSSLVRQGDTWYADTKEEFGEVCLSSEDSHSWELNGNRGYYADSYQNATVLFGVVRLRTSKYTIYAPVTWSSEWDGATLHFDDAVQVERGCDDDDKHTDALRDAYRYADRCADIEAEHAREDDAKYQAAELIADRERMIEEERETLRYLLDERREARTLRGQYPAICGTVTKSIKKCIADIRDWQCDIEKFRENYWEAVPNW